MGISQIGVAAATASPASASRPMFTLANTYDLSGSISTYESASHATDMIYDRANQKICFPVTNTTTTNAFAVWTPGTTSVTRYNLPLSLQNDTYKFIIGRDDAIWYVPGLEGSNYGLYRSTNGGSSWTNPVGSSTKYELIALSTEREAIINPTDNVPVMWFDGAGTSSPYVINMTNTTLYLPSINNVGTTTGTNTKYRMAPIVKGDDTGVISGYHCRLNCTHSANSGTGAGTVSFVNIRAYHNRTGGGYLISNKQQRNYNTAYEVNAEFAISGRTTCIEGRWFYTVGEQHHELYDMQNTTFIGDIPQLSTYFNGRLVYLSSTKKAYIYNKYLYKMYEYDVTFI